ncbi:MAG: DUF6261 family protein [Tannerella sp.]|jgi:hypothetical protein|nr:DUF6261 family protein [Tannerella sp.]
METKKFSPLYIGQLKLSHLFTLNKSTIEIALPLYGIAGALIDAAFTQLQTVNIELDKRLNRPMSSMLTPELKQLEIKRDGIFEEIKRDVKTAAKSSDVAKGNAGRILYHFLTPYWAIDKQAMNTESGLIDEMIGRYNNDQTLVGSAEIIGITPLWTELNAVNINFEMLYYERNAEIAAKDDAAGKYRREGVKSYENFCTLVEQAVNLTPTHELEILFDQMDHLRKTYHALVSKKKDDLKED